MCFLMASKISYGFGLLCFCYIVVCENVDGREFHSNIKEKQQRFFIDASSGCKNQFEGHNTTRDSNESHHSSWLVHDNPPASLRQYDEPDDYVKRWAIYYTENGHYYGSTAKINLWGLPDVKPHHISTTAMWVMDSDGSNFVQAGFHVDPQNYHDNKLHFFIFWTADRYKSTGCFNLHCKGFVMVNWNLLTPGSAITPLSTYNGKQYYITISIKKDPRTKDWMLYRDDIEESQLIGYWPRSLFKTLVDSAVIIDWGGFVLYPKNETGPPMGSGHYADELEGKAAYIKNLKIFDSEGQSRELIDGAQLPATNRRNCYDVTTLVNSDKFGLHDGYVFYFGGPAGCSE